MDRTKGCGYVGWLLGSSSSSRSQLLQQQQQQQKPQQLLQQPKASQAATKTTESMSVHGFVLLSSEKQAADWMAARHHSARVQLLPAPMEYRLSWAGRMSEPGKQAGRQGGRQASKQIGRQAGRQDRVDENFCGSTSIRQISRSNRLG